MSFKAPELAILFTLAYTDQFDFPLTEPELWQRLVSIDGENFSRAEFKKALLKLTLQKQIEITEFFVTLAGRGELVEKRKHRANIAEQKKKEIALFKGVLAYIPGVEAAFITGSVAMDNAEADDDLDLLVVTKTERLWLTRALLLGVTWILGKKKARSDEGKHGWCLNLWLDQDHLAVEEQKRDLYQAYEVLQATPLYGKPEAIAAFYQANAWTNTYLPHVEKKYKDTPAQTLTEISIGNAFLNWLETLAFTLQLNYMNAHRTTENVGKGFAFFHPRPTGKVVKEGWRHALDQLKTPELGTIAKQYAGTLFN